MDATIYTYTIILFVTLFVNADSIYKYFKFKSTDRENNAFYMLNITVTVNSLLAIMLLAFAERQYIIKVMVFIPIISIILSYYCTKKINKVSIDDYRDDWKTAKLNTYLLNNNTKKIILYIYSISLLCIIFYLVIIPLLPWNT